MKDKILLIIFSIFCIFTISCKEETKTNKFTEVSTWIKECYKTTDIVDPIEEFPVVYESDSTYTISWMSLDDSCISSSGNIVGRPKDTFKEVEVIYTISHEDETFEDSIIFKVYPKSFESIYKSFMNQFGNGIYESYDYIETSFKGGSYVEWSSSVPEIFNNDGVYNKPNEDTEIILNVRTFVSDSLYKDYFAKVMCFAYTSQEKMNLAYNWICNEIIADRAVSSDMNLPTVDSRGVEISWKSYDKNILEEDGTVHRNVFDRYVELLATFNYNGATLKKMFWIKVKALDISKLSQNEILEKFLDSIAVSQIEKKSFAAYPNISGSYNMLNLFKSEWEPHVEYLAPVYDPVTKTGDNVPCVKKTSTEYICVHDTANTGSTATALMHAKYVSGGGGGTSFHYVVGNDGIYHLVEDNLAAFHAGDSSASLTTVRPDTYYDTGIKATWECPNMGISLDGYFTINGIKTEVPLPDGANPYSTLCDSELFIRVGENGNYLIHDNYYNKSYGYISNYGGNSNSIGIETCVNSGSDYFETLRLNIDLVAKLCLDNNLSVDRVTQHNSYSGKPCPQAIRTAHYWQNFRDAVSMKLFGMTHFEGLEFNWTTDENLNNDGLIKREPSSKVLSYSVSIKKDNAEIFAKTFTTNLAD